MKTEPINSWLRRLSLLAFSACLLSSNVLGEPEKEDEDIPTLIRTWTAAEGDFSVEAKAIRLTEKKITLKRVDNNQTIPVDISMLSEEDRNWIESNKDFIGKTPQELKAMPTTELAKALKGKTKGLVGEKWMDKEPKRTAKLFIVYFSASWCPPCRAGAPHSVLVYNEKVSKMPELEVVMCNLDNTEADAKAWAEKEKMPWPMLAGRDKMIDEFKKIAPRGIPNMKLVDGKGEVLAEGSMDTLIQKAKEYK